MLYSKREQRAYTSVAERQAECTYIKHSKRLFLFRHDSMHSIVYTVNGIESCLDYYTFRRYPFPHHLTLPPRPPVPTPTPAPSSASTLFHPQAQSTLHVYSFFLSTTTNIYNFPVLETLMLLLFFCPRLCFCLLFSGTTLTPQTPIRLLNDWSLHTCSIDMSRGYPTDYFIHVLYIDEF